MSIPIQKVRFANEISVPLRKNAATTPVPAPNQPPSTPAQSGPAGVVTPMVNNMSWNILGNERYMPFHFLPKTQQRRMTTIYDAISGPSGIGTEKLSMNFYSDSDEVNDLKDYLDFLYSKHRARSSLSSQVEFFMPQTTSFMMNEECYYGLAPTTMSEFDMMVTGRLSLVLVRVIVGIMVKNNNKDLPDQLFQRGMLAFREENDQTSKDWPEQLPGEQPAIRDSERNFLTLDEYSAVLAKRFFALFKFYLDQNHFAMARQSRPANERQRDAQPGEIIEIPGADWNTFVKDMREYSISPSRVLYEYMKSLAVMKINHGERMNDVLGKVAVSAVPLSLPLVTHEEDPDISSVWPARAEHFLGRRGRKTSPTTGIGGMEIPGRTVKEVAFFDARHMSDAFESMAGNAWSLNFREMLHRLEQYSKDVIRRTDPDPTNLHAHLHKKRMVFLTRHKIQSVDVAPGASVADRHDFAGIDYLEMPEASVEEVREQRLPYLMREQLVAPARDVPGASKVETPTRFLYKMIKDERYQKSMSIINTLTAKWLSTKKNPTTLMAERPGMIALAKQLGTEECAPYCYNEVEYLVNMIVSTPEASFFDKNTVGFALNTIRDMMAHPKEYVMVDPWSRNDKGKLIDSSGSELDVSEYVAEIDDTDPAGSMTISVRGEQGKSVTLARVGTGAAPDSAVGTWRGEGVELTFASENHGTMTKGKAQKSFSWKQTARWRFQVVLSNMPPAFNPFFNTWLSKVADLIGGTVSAKQVASLVAAAMSSSNMKNKETGEDKHRFLFDKNDNQVRTTVDDTSRKDYLLCKMDDFMDRLSLLYKDALFSDLVGNNKEAMGQFEVWPKKRIEKGYIPQIKNLKNIIGNYKYSLALEAYSNSMERSRGDIEAMKKGILQMLRDTPEAEMPLGRPIIFFEAIKDPEKLRQILIDRIKVMKSNCFLLHGPAGTGKTSFAGHLAKILGYNVISWKIAGGKNKWVGDTTKFINAAFAILGKLRNFVIIIDEVDTVLEAKQDAHVSDQDVQGAFLDGFESLAEKSKNNDSILVSTTNHKDKMDERTQQRLRGRGTGSPKAAIEVSVPSDTNSIKELMELWMRENDMIYLPSPAEFAEACTNALFQAQNQRNPKNFGPGTISEILTEWLQTTVVRHENIVVYVKQEKDAGRMTEQQAAQNLAKVDELSNGPNAFVFLVRSLPPVPQSGLHEGQISIGPLLEEANSAERLLGSVSTDRVRGGEPLPAPSTPGEQPVTSPFREQPPAAVSPHGREPAPAFSPSGPSKPPVVPPVGPVAPTAFNRKMVRRKNG